MLAVTNLQQNGYKGNVGAWQSRKIKIGFLQEVQRSVSEKCMSSLLLEQIPFFFLSSLPLLLQGRLKGVKIHTESRTILMREFFFSCFKLVTQWMSWYFLFCSGNLLDFLALDMFFALYQNTTLSYFSCCSWNIWGTKNLQISIATMFQCVVPFH